MRRANIDRSTGSGPVQRRGSAGSWRYCLCCVPLPVDIPAATCGTPGRGKGIPSLLTC